MPGWPHHEVQPRSPELMPRHGPPYIEHWPAPPPCSDSLWTPPVLIVALRPGFESEIYVVGVAWRGVLDGLRAQDLGRTM